MPFQVDTDISIWPQGRSIGRPANNEWTDIVATVRLLAPNSTESFLIPYKDIKLLRAAASYLSQLQIRKGFRVTTRTEQETAADGTNTLKGLRVWRLE